MTTYNFTEEPQEIALEEGVIYIMRGQFKNNGMLWVHHELCTPKRLMDGSLQKRDAIGYRTQIDARPVGRKEKKFVVWTEGATQPITVELQQLRKEEQKKFTYIEE